MISDDQDRETTLRRRAERLLRGTGQKLEGQSQDLLELLQELNVHQAELSIQNEELRNIQQDLERSTRLYHALFELAPVGYLRLDPAGRVLQANLAAAGILGHGGRLEGTQISAYVELEFAEVLRAHFLQASQGGTAVSPDINLLGDHTGRRTVQLFTSALPLAVSQGGYLTALVDLTSQRAAEERAQQRQENLQDSQTALRVVMDDRLMERQSLETAVQENLRRTVLPRLDRLRQAKSPEQREILLDALEAGLVELTSGFTRTLSSPEYDLSNRELEVAGLVRNGHTTDQISDFLCISRSTVLFHRNNLRVKLGLKKKKISLAAYLRQLK
ncbi:MAG: LuxR C-terminal-related transcriptional regulator [Deltaproteobacteria bacterium]|nr:LuxR C-terminal-related transcriptional regulator [Deltaproteobacteria bacterium]